MEKLANHPDETAQLLARRPGRDTAKWGHPGVSSPFLRSGLLRSETPHSEIVGAWRLPAGDLLAVLPLPASQHAAP